MRLFLGNQSCCLLEYFGSIFSVFFCSFRYINHHWKIDRSLFHPIFGQSSKLNFFHLNTHCHQAWCYRTPRTVPCGHFYWWIIAGAQFCVFVWRCQFPVSKVVACRLLDLANEICVLGRICLKLASHLALIKCNLMVCSFFFFLHSKWVKNIFLSPTWAGAGWQHQLLVYNLKDFMVMGKDITLKP